MPPVLRSRLRISLLCIVAALTIAMSTTAAGDASAYAPPDPALVARARELHAGFLTLDSHLDTPLVLRRPGFDIAQRHSWDEHLSQVDFPRMREGGLDGGFFVIFVPQGPRTPEARERAKAAGWRALELIHEMAARYPDLCEIAYRADDAERIRQAGKHVVFLGIENSYVLGRDLDQLAAFHARGVRYLGLTHTSNTDLADSSTDPKGTEHNGLSDLGRAAIAECNRLGILVDISHASDKAAFDAIALSRAPILASHSGAYAVFPHPRNLPDSVLHEIRRTGGVVQMNIFSAYLMPVPPDPDRTAAFGEWIKRWGGGRDLSPDQHSEALAARLEIERRYPKPLATLSHVADHIDHLVKVLGIDHVGISGDFDGGGGVLGCNDVSELPNLTAELLRRGYGEDDLRKFWGANLMRVLREAERVAAEIQAEETARTARPAPSPPAS